MLRSIPSPFDVTLSSTLIFLCININLLQHAIRSRTWCVLGTRPPVMRTEYCDYVLAALYCNGCAVSLWHQVCPVLCIERLQLRHEHTWQSTSVWQKKYCAEWQLTGSRCLTHDLCAIFVGFTQRDNCAIAIVNIIEVSRGPAGSPILQYT